MRGFLRAQVPAMVAGIYRPSDGVTPPSVQACDEWSWPEAEKRIRKAYEEEGFAGWIKAALVELEIEAHIERRKRGLDKSSVSTGSS